MEYCGIITGAPEFLEAWLTLLEKMVNPKAILESPHSIPKPPDDTPRQNTYSFNALKYLIQIHKMAFEAIILLWGRKPPVACGARITDLVLTILLHILRGEKIIAERMSNGAASSVREESNINPEHLKHLEDMGFPTEHAVEALLNTPTMEQATDYLLSMPVYAPRSGSSGINDDPDEEQVIQAIALSLSEPFANTSAEEEDFTPLSATKVDTFSQNALKVCLRLIQVVPASIHKVCELLGALCKRNGAPFRNKVLQELLVEISGLVGRIMCAAQSEKDNLTVMNKIGKSEHAVRLSSYTHLYTLLFEVSSYFEMRFPCGAAVSRTVLIAGFTDMIMTASKVMAEGYLRADLQEPKWLTPALLFLDSLGKAATCAERRRLVHGLTYGTWKWYDFTGQWTPYSDSNNQLIEKAYWSGEPSVRITCGRQKYTVTFHNMLQCNEESGNNRPVCMEPFLTSAQSEPLIGRNLTSDARTIAMSFSDKHRSTFTPKFTQLQKKNIVKSCVRLMHIPIDKDLLHAILRICLRFTRDFTVAKVFVNEGGIRCLLGMRQTSAFSGYCPLVKMIIRHALEEPVTLSLAMENVLRCRTLKPIPPVYRDCLYLLRQLGGAITRDPDNFLRIAKEVVRLDYNDVYAGKHQYLLNLKKNNGTNIRIVSY